MIYSYCRASRERCLFFVLTESCAVFVLFLGALSLSALSFKDITIRCLLAADRVTRASCTYMHLVLFFVRLFLVIP